jgi:rare lipoprotein A
MGFQSKRARYLALSFATVIVLNACMAFRQTPSLPPPPPPSPSPAPRPVLLKPEPPAASLQRVTSLDHPLFKGLDMKKKFLPMILNEGPGRKYENSEGKMSYYHEPQKTASGERFDPDESTGAHRALPLGSVIRVTNLANGRSATLIIKDRGPFVKGVVLDVSHGIARRLRMLKVGVVECRIEVLAYPDEKSSD